MRGGHVDAVTRLSVSGWAADADAPDAALELTIEVDGQEVGRTLAGRPRRDLAVLGRYGDGAHGFSFNFPAALSAHEAHGVRVLFEDGALMPGGEKTVAAEVVAPAGGDAPSPILVTAPGRSGTTYLMSCLAAAPQIVVAELVPYEVRLLSYYAAAYAVLTAPADTERSTHPDRLEGDGFHIGFNPFAAPQYAHAFSRQPPLRDYTENWAPARLGETMAGLVREYYRRLAVDRGKHGVRFFAEKNNNLHRPTRLFVRRVFPAVREVVIVRDPRDVLCSHVAYFDSSQDKAFQQLSHSCRQLTQIRAEAGPDLCIIRYEDMIRRDAATYARLGAFLEADVAPMGESEGSRIFAQHATSLSPEASIGRWRTDLPAALRARCAAEWGEFLALFGYAAD